MNVQKTLLAAAVLFALAACQPDPAGSVANASEDDPLLVQEEDDGSEPDEDDDPDDGDEEDGDDSDGDDADEGDEPEDTDAVASSPAEVTEHADEAADDALLDTRQGGNPLVNSPVAPVDPIAQEDEGEDDDGE